MQKDELGNTRKRYELSKTCREMGMSVSTFANLTDPMRGKSEEEKEQIATQILEKIAAGEITADT